MAPQPYSATAPIKALRGSNTNPSVTFTGDENTGLYSSGDNELSVATNGSQKAKFDADGLEVQGDLDLNSGGLYSTTIQSVTPTANRTITFPDQTGTVGLVSGATGSIQFNQAGALNGTSDFSTSLVWNNAATTFTGLKLNVTDTASAADSKLLDLQVGGASKFKVIPTGKVTIPYGTGSVTGLQLGNINLDTNGPSTFTVRVVNARSFQVASAGAYANAYYLGVDGGGPIISRDATSVLKVADSSTGTGYLKLPPTTVGALTAAATVGAGTKTFVTDSTSTLSSHHGQIVVGGGSNFVPVYSDGTNWIVG